MFVEPCPSGLDMSAKRTLVEEQIAVTTLVGGRSALRTVAVVVGAAAGLATEGCHRAPRVTMSCTDTDAGAGADLAGHGRCIAPDGGGATPDSHVTPDASRTPDAYAPPDMGTSCSDSDPTDPGGAGIHC